MRGRGGGGRGGRGPPLASPPAAPALVSSGTGHPASPPLAQAGRLSPGRYLRSRCQAAPASAAEVPPPPSLNSAALPTASGLLVGLPPEDSPSSRPLLGNAPSNGIPSGVVTRGARSLGGGGSRGSEGNPRPPSSRTLARFHLSRLPMCQVVIRASWGHLSFLFTRV